MKMAVSELTSISSTEISRFGEEIKIFGEEYKNNFKDCLCIEQHSEECIKQQIVRILSQIKTDSRIVDLTTIENATEAYNDRVTGDALYTLKEELESVLFRKIQQTYDAEIIWEEDFPAMLSRMASTLRGENSCGTSTRLWSTGEQDVATWKTAIKEDYKERNGCGCLFSHTLRCSHALIKEISLTVRPPIIRADVMEHMSKYDDVIASICTPVEFTTAVVEKSCEEQRRAIRDRVPIQVIPKGLRDRERSPRNQAPRCQIEDAQYREDLYGRIMANANNDGESD